MGISAKGRSLLVAARECGTGVDPGTSKRPAHEYAKSRRGGVTEVTFIAEGAGVPVDIRDPMLKVSLAEAMRSHQRAYTLGDEEWVPRAGTRDKVFFDLTDERESIRATFVSSGVLALALNENRWLDVDGVAWEVGARNTRVLWYDGEGTAEELGIQLVAGLDYPLVQGGHWMQTAGRDVAPGGGEFGDAVFEFFNEGCVSFGEEVVTRIIFVVGSEKVGRVDLQGAVFPVAELDRSGKSMVVPALSYDISAEVSTAVRDLFVGVRNMRTIFSQYVERRWDVKVEGRWEEVDLLRGTLVSTFGVPLWGTKVVNGDMDGDRAWAREHPVIGRERDAVTCFDTIRFSRRQWRQKAMCSGTTFFSRGGGC